MRSDRALERLGGVATTERLLRVTSRARLQLAVARGLVVRDARGRYSLPGVDEALRAANRLSGVLVEDSAAQYLGWQLKHPPRSPCIAVPRNRHLTADRTAGVRVRFRDLDPDDVNGLATRPMETVLRCAAWMPFDEALVVADDALRSGSVIQEELVCRAHLEPVRFRSRCVRVAEAADVRAENAFESVLRAIALSVPGLHVEPQVWLGDIGRPDLVDQQLGIVVEADSFEFHGRRRALKLDCERYNAFVVDGWLVIRFAWEHVMFRPDYVRSVLAALVARLSGQPLGHALGPAAQRRSA
ncbi:hypothetical protein [Nocardioides mesophilus]|uniref:DUF559 domain-containing protein n=1 Tax=Nocardioides mesophilus TaxID=433659 RepID=A0A7G9RE91_9ACTN|nr:hypothetical protein [Nocardioides mesophilus]QNN53916.1 hypothetical protein H9L09_05880 [Nocardioides mesophilus]